MEKNIRENSDETDLHNGDKFVRRAKTTSARHWIITKADLRAEMESKIRLENISKLRQVFINTRRNVAALRRYQRESQRGQYDNHQRDVITRRFSANPEMVHRKRTASVRKLRGNISTSRDTTATARRKYVSVSKPKFVWKFDCYVHVVNQNQNNTDHIF
jgi:tRNA U34 5-carboxymethylaminomethyl modifying GTPase MnmE/TrmE